MRRYLLVDDNRDLAENLAEILASEGAEAVAAVSGQQALEQVRGSRFDALVTDMRLPAMDGVDLVHAIRRVDPGLPALAMTGYARGLELAAARRDGLVAVLEKPVPLPRLLALLAAARRDGLVALVADDRGRADGLAEGLVAHGFAAVAAASLTDTDRLGPVVPCCAIADLLGAGGSGGEALRRLESRFPALPVLAIAAPAAEPLPHWRLFREPVDRTALLHAVEALHGARPDATP